MYDLQKIRTDFPILSREVYGRPLVYLDNAATTQKPLCVLDAMRDEYLNVNANVHRGVHYLSQQATDLHEAARETVRQFINARKTEEIVFTRGTTESINLVANCLARLTPDPSPRGEGRDYFLGRTATNHITPLSPRGGVGGEAIVTTMEHHSNIVPWQLNGFRVRPIPITDDGQLLLDEYEKLFTEQTRIVAVAHVSNVLGVVNPVEEIIRIAHEHGVPVLVDGAQSAPHFAVDMLQLDCDFFAFSGHKMYGPTGVGVLYGKEEWLDRLPPYQGGGEMIDKVSFEKTTFNQLPYKFEAGTPDYVATHGLATAINYLQAIGLDDIHAHEQTLARYAIEQLSQIEGIKIYGLTPGPSPKGEGRNMIGGESPGNVITPLSLWGGVGGEAVVSFNVADIHHLDLGTLLDRLGIAVRTGHHCAQPLMDRLQILGTVRASFALYNTRDEVDALVEGLRRVVKMF